MSAAIEGVPPHLTRESSRELTCPEKTVNPSPQSRRTTYHIAFHPALLFPFHLAFGALVVLFALGCTESSVEPNLPEPLRGLAAASSTDSAGNTPPAPPGGDATPGYVQGTVLGPSAPGAGNDSLLTAPRVAGARIAAYPVLGGTTATPELGAEAAFAFTGADGKFTLPAVPGGSYVVTINPPEGSIYGGVWVTVVIHDQSHLFPWWVVLWKR